MAHLRRLLATALFLCVGLVAIAEEGVVREEGELVVELQDKRIKESSGLALGWRNPSVFWTVNDSGGEPCVFAVDRNGKTRAKVRIKGAANFDWEDLDIGPDSAGKPAIFVGDIGDNFRLRPSIQVYQITEPDIAKDGEDVKETESEAPLIWHAAYPDARQNAESLMVHPKTGRLYVITKSESGQCGLYAFPETLKSEGGMTLEKVVSLDFPPQVRVGKRPKDACQTTSAAFSPNGLRLIVSTYSYLHEWTWKDGEDLADVLTRPSVQILPLLVPQLEGICYDANGRTLWFTSERLPAPLYRISR